jgi:hypothetical protein
MRVFGVVLLVFALILGICNIVALVGASYDYERMIESSWNLADKASTIKQKTANIDQFVAALEASGLKGEHDAIWQFTPNNSFDKNLEAVKSLQQRLHEIEGMDVTSLAYQTAISQITAQEQGEAKKMLEVFEGCWYKVQHPWLWQWKGAINTIVNLVALIMGAIMFFAGGSSSSGYRRRW